MLIIFFGECGLIFLKCYLNKLLVDIPLRRIVVTVITKNTNFMFIISLLFEMARVNDKSL